MTQPKVPHLVGGRRFHRSETGLRPVDRAAIIRATQDLARHFPPDDRHGLLDCDRTVFHVELVLARAGRDAVICDLGGGLSLFSAVCASLGLKSYLVDDFKDPYYRGKEELLNRVHRAAGVCVHSVHLGAESIENLFQVGSVDVFTAFAFLEHWHHSPRTFLQSLMKLLRPRGWLVINTPNCVNLRKRLTAPLGRLRWSPLEEWYQEEEFRGHVREPSVADLLYIGNDLGLAEVEMLGRNWQGYYREQSRPVRVLTRVVDPLLQRRPSLCSDLYLLARKPL